ncbi:uncharacterized protein ACRADG_010703 [Cochliomyia hominivorax]
MPLSLTNHRRQQTSSSSSSKSLLNSNKWSSTQHQHLRSDSSATVSTGSLNPSASSNNLLRHHYLNQTIRKQKSFLDSSQFINKSHLLSAHAERSYLSRGLSVGRSHDIQQQRSFIQRHPLKKHSSITIQQNCNVKNESESLKTGDLIKRNITNCSLKESSGGGGEFLRNSRRIQAWSSTSSILKSLDKELAQLNGVVGKCKDVKVLKGKTTTEDKTKSSNPKTDSTTASTSHSCRKTTKPEINKVNLSIVLSPTLNSTKEENDCPYSDQEAEGDHESDESSSSDSNKILNSQTKSKDQKKSDNLRPSSQTPGVSAQQKRALYHNSRLATNFALSNNNLNSSALNCGLQNSQNFNASPSLTVQKRPPLVRAMSAPVRSFDESSKSATFLASKRKSRRRKLNSRYTSCDKTSADVLATKDLSSLGNRKVLTRSKSVAPDVITLVSLISSEGSDSEKEDNSIIVNDSHKSSPTKRAPSLRKTGKSVSFQENYPPTFQFASKEYSHMLRRGSIAPLAQRIKSNRPPTAPPGSIFLNTQKSNNDMLPTPNSGDVNEENENNLENNKNNENNSSLVQNLSDKTLEEDYEFPHYVRTLKERECWKLYMKMSTKGVNITYDTILRGMLTPTEFRQLQKQREIEEAKALKAAAEENSLLEGKPKGGSSSAIERLKETLLKN